MIFKKTRRYFRNLLRNRYGFNLESIRQKQYYEQFAYGHREVLLEYSGLPSNLLFKAVIPHGKIAPHSLDPIVPVFDVESGEELLQLLWRDDSIREANSIGAKSVISVGAPFLYALSNRGQSIEETTAKIKHLSENYDWTSSQESRILNSREKITYLPLHSWDGDVHKHIVPENYLLKKIDPKRITVCLGFLDFCNPEVRDVYLTNGWELTCAGARASKIVGSPAGGRENFLYELMKIFDHSDLVISNEFTTGLFYAAARGKKIGILPTGSSQELIYSSWSSEASFNDVLEKQRSTFGWLWGDAATPSKIFSDLSCSLGIESFRSPDFFKNEIDKTEFSGYGINKKSELQSFGPK